MAFQIKSQHLDVALGQHVIDLHDEVSGAHHIVQIIVGSSSCPLCGHVKVNDIGHIDPKAIVREIQDNLHAAHEQVHAYARKHNIPVKQAK